MRRVVIESPYAGDIESNVAYARRALRDSLSQGEAPFASHLLYPQTLDDTDPVERSRGLQAGYEWLQAAEAVVFYVDRGWSKGMLAALRIARLFQKPIEIRGLDRPTPKEPPDEYPR